MCSSTRNARLFALFCLLSSCLVPSMAVAQSREANPASTASTASISGRVLLGDKPVANIAVALLPERLLSLANSLAKATTDEDGRYRLSNLGPGSYRVTALAPGLIVVSDGSPYEHGKGVTLQEGETIDGINLTLKRGAAISGRVTDASGQPVIEAYIHLQRFNDRGQPADGFYPNLYEFFTDDRGRYRVYGLPAGRYKVSTGEANNEFIRLGSAGGYYKRTYHPDVADEAKATIVELAEGGEANGVDITLAAKAKTYVASGVVVDAATGRPVPNVRFGYGIVREGSGTWGMTSQRTNADGEFRLEGVSPGRYEAYVPRDDKPDTYSDPVTFEVKDEDVSGIAIKLHRGATISGVAVIEGDSTALARFSPIFVGAHTRRENAVNQPSFSSPTVAADGSFRLTSIIPGKVTLYMRDGNSEQKVFLIRLEYNGEDVTEGFDVKAGDHIAGLRAVLVAGTGIIRGQVIGDNGTIPEGVRISVHARPLNNRIKNGWGKTVDARGRFVIENLPEGEYELNLSVSGTGRPGKPVSQRVNVTGEGETLVTLPLNSTEKEK